MADNVTKTPDSPKVQAALKDAKKNVLSETATGAVIGGLSVFEAAEEFAGRGPGVALGVAGAVAGAAYGNYDAKKHNRKLDDIAANSEPVSRNAALQKEKLHVGGRTAVGVVGGGAMAGAAAFVATHAAEVSRNGKIAIIGGSVALGATALGALLHSHSKKENNKIAKLATVLDEHYQSASPQGPAR